MAVLTYAAFSADPASAGIAEADFDRLLPLAVRTMELITGWPAGVFELSAEVEVYVRGRKARWLSTPKPPHAVTTVEEVTRRAGPGDDPPEERAEVVYTRYYVDPSFEAKRRSAIEAEDDGWVRRVHYVVTGTFGLVAEDGSVLPVVQDVAATMIRLRYAAEQAGDGTVGVAGDPVAGSVQEMDTDGFRWRLFDSAADGQVVPGTLTGRRDIDGVLQQLRPLPHGGSTYRGQATTPESRYPSFV